MLKKNREAADSMKSLFAKWAPWQEKIKLLIEMSRHNSENKTLNLISKFNRNVGFVRIYRHTDDSLPQNKNIILFIKNLEH